MKNFVILSFLIFNLSSCSDPCDNVVCNNGGVCIDGTCDCELGFEGADCSISSTPNSIRLDKIRVLQYPSYNSQLNEPWDIDIAPDDLYADLIISIYDFTAGTGLALRYQTNEYTKYDAAPNQTHEFFADQDYFIENLSGVHYINLTDNDILSTDEEIKNVAFKPDTTFLLNPTTVAIIKDSVHLEVDLIYSF